MLRCKRLSFIIPLLTLLSICTSAATINIWSPQSDELNNIIRDLSFKDFTARTGIKANIQTIPRSGFEQRYLLASISDEVPDIGITSSLSSANLGVRGIVTDLRNYDVELEKILNEIHPGLMRSATYQNKLFGLPTQVFFYPMIYRKDILYDLGMEVPDTWDELYGILPKLQVTGGNFYSSCAFQDFHGDVVYADASMFIWQNGGDWYNKDRTRSALDSDQALKGFKEFTELYTKRGVPTSAEANVGFIKGDLPLLLTPVWQYGNLNNIAPSLRGKWDLALVPGKKQLTGAINRASYIDGTVFVVFEKSRQKDLSLTWLKWFFSPRIQNKIVAGVSQEMPGGIFIPATKKAFGSLPLPKTHIPLVLRQIETGLAPPFSLAAEYLTQLSINEAAYEAVIEGKDPVRSLLRAAENINEQLAKKQKEYLRFLGKL